MSRNNRAKRTVELLAPGGSMEGIRSCVNAGADAVYAGGRLFGARAYADNPGTEEILDAIDYCHLHGVKLYLTVNTLLKDNELINMLPEFLAPIYEHGADAVLVQDFGVFRFLREHFPDLPLHASTQMTLTGEAGVRLLESMGAERCVLSRELSLDEIRRIHDRCGIELETFVHGALCYCYSGKCLMSSMIGGRSGNRGRCAQPCRLPWDLYEDAGAEGKIEAKNNRGAKDSRRNKGIKGTNNIMPVNRPGEKYLLSPRDICTLRILPDLIDAGITSLKIEGRMKSPEYAAGVTSVYRRYIDMYLRHGRAGYRVDRDDERILQRLFSRGDFSEGYYHEHNGRDMMTLVRKAEEKGDELRRSQETAAHIREQYVVKDKKISLRGRAVIRRDMPAQLTVSDMRGHSCTAEGFVPSMASSRPASAADVLKQIRRTGNTDFVFSDVDVELDEGLFVPVRELNELRRSALDSIREAILGESRRSFRAGSECGRNIMAGAGFVQPGGTDIRQVSESDHAGDNSVGEQQDFLHPPVTASVLTDEQLEAVLSADMAGGVYLDYSVCTSENVRRVRDSGRKAYLALPDIWRADTAGTVEKMVSREFGAFSPDMKEHLDGILVRCCDQLHTLGEAGLLFGDDGFEIIADASLYTWNRYARAELSALGVTMDTLPFECSRRELKERGCTGSECVVYGYQTLMTSAQCLLKTAAFCRHEPGVRYLRDRRGVLFPVRNDCRICTGIIYNSVPLELVSLSDQVKELRPSSIRYQFTIEGTDETRRILAGKMPDAVTRGHFRKGVE